MEYLRSSYLRDFFFFPQRRREERGELDYSMNTHARRALLLIALLPGALARGEPRRRALAACAGLSSECHWGGEERFCAAREKPAPAAILG